MQLSELYSRLKQGVCDRAGAVMEGGGLALRGFFHLLGETADFS